MINIERMDPLQESLLHGQDEESSKRSYIEARNSFTVYLLFVFSLLTISSHSSLFWWDMENKRVNCWFAYT